MLTSPTPSSRSARATLPGLLRRPMVAAAIALAAMIVTLATAQMVEARSARRVGHSRQVARLAQQALIAATEREMAARGFLLTGDSASLARATVAGRALHARLDSLIAQAAFDGGQLARARVIRQAVLEWETAFVAPVIGGEAADRTTALEARRRIFDAMQRRVAEFIEAEAAVHDRRAGRLAALRAAGMALLILELVIVAAALLIAGRRLREQSAQLVEQQGRLEDQAVELEQQTDEAQALARELRLSNAELRAALEDARSARVAERDADVSRLEALSQLDAALASAPIGLAFYDRELRCRRINATLAKINGLPPEAHVGKRIGELLPELGPLVEPQLERVLGTGLPVLNVSVSDALLPRSTRGRSFLASYYPINANGSGPIGVGVVVVETTDQQQLEAQLRQAQKMEAVGQLAGGIAHDFNNMLTAIKSFSELALDQLDLEHPVRNDVREIRAAADRAAALTRQLLAFSRRQLLQPVVLDLNAVTEGLEELLGRLLGGQIGCVWMREPNLDLVRADPSQIEQIVMNLAVNARDAMPDGGRLTIETSNVEIDTAYAERIGDLAPGPYVALAISDTGIGMDAATMARIYEPFFTTKEAGKGTGLGLSTVFGIVKQSGGHITVYSEPGRGTTFRIYLPRAEAARPLVARAGTGGEPRGGSETILLVEDDAAVRSVACRILNRHGYGVLEASTPAEALDLVREHRSSIELVLTDLILPGITGRELAEQLLAIRPRMRLLYMSGYTDDAVVRRGLLEPGMPFLSKPFTVDAVARAVRAALERER